MSGTPNPIPQKVFDLFNQFTHLRENGVNRDDAWYRLVDENVMPPGIQKAVLELAKDWERREGHQYHYRSQDNDDTLSRRQMQQLHQAASQEQQRRQQQPPSRPPDSSLTGGLDPTRLREYEQQRLDQILDQLDSPPTPSPGPKPGNNGRTAPIGLPPDHFGPRTILLMYFKGYPEPLRVTIAGEDELIIGRTTPNSAMAPEIDLNRVNAGDFGVSRMHAAITRRNNKLLITDLGSMNRTHINGVRLLEHEVRPLSDGDEIWFAQLYCRVRFRHK